MAETPPVQPAAGCVRPRDTKHVVNWWRLEGGPWVCHLCHPNPHGAVYVTAHEARRVVQISLRTAAAFARRPLGTPTAAPAAAGAAPPV